MNRLTDDEVKHVAMLARLKLKDEEITTYAYKLKEIMDSIEKIKDVKLETDEMLVILVKRHVNYLSIRKNI